MSYDTPAKAFSTNVLDSGTGWELSLETPERMEVGAKPQNSNETLDDQELVQIPNEVRILGSSPVNSTKVNLRGAADTPLSGELLPS